MRLHPHPSTILFRQNIFLREQRTSDGSSPAVQSAILSTACFGNTSILAEAACESSDLIYSVEGISPFHGQSLSPVPYQGIPSTCCPSAFSDGRAEGWHRSVEARVGIRRLLVVLSYGTVRRPFSPFRLFTRHPSHPPTLPLLQMLPLVADSSVDFPESIEDRLEDGIAVTRSFFCFFSTLVLNPYVLCCSCVVQSAECCGLSSALLCCGTLRIMLKPD